MPEVSATTAPATEAQSEVAITHLIMTEIFRQVLKKPESDEETSSAVDSEINKTIARTMSQSVTGFGL